MSWWWLPLAFAVGAFVEFKFGRYAVRFLSRSDSRVAHDSLRKLDHDSLVALMRKTTAELARRRSVT